MSDLKFDNSCIPYPRKGLYWIINLPYLILLIVTAVYLWQYSVPVSLIYIGLYIVSIILHGYICAFAGCPYKGKVCPGAFAYFPVGKIAVLYDKLGAKKSDNLIGLFFVIISLFLLGIIVLPLYWISNLGTGYAIGYVTVILVYFIVFVWTICPRCAMRFNCPMAKLSDLLHRKIQGNNILE